MRSGTKEMQTKQIKKNETREKLDQEAGKWTKKRWRKKGGERR